MQDFDGKGSCQKCGGTGHAATICTSNVGFEGTECYRCGGKGHIMKLCPTPSTRPEALCFNCNQPGHIQANCPHVNAMPRAAAPGYMRSVPDTRNVGFHPYARQDDPFLQMNIRNDPLLYRRAHANLDDQSYSSALELHGMQQAPPDFSFPAQYTNPQVVEEDCQCYRCGARGHMADACQIPTREGQDICFNCHNPGHKQDTCPVKQNALKECYHCHQLGHIARDCPSLHPQAAQIGHTPFSERECFTCHQVGHVSRDCPNKAINSGDMGKECYHCHEIGHIAANCPGAGQPNNIIPVTERECYFCHRVGHMAANCPDKNIKPQSNPMDEQKQCFNCGELGHVKSNCPTSTPKCFQCGEMGHMKKDCMQLRGAPECFNCRKIGHRAEECPLNQGAMPPPSSLAVQQALRIAALSRMIPRSYAPELGRGRFTVQNADLRCIICGGLGHSMEQCPSSPI